MTLHQAQPPASLMGWTFLSHFSNPDLFLLNCSTHLSCHSHILILFSSLHIGYGQPCSLSWLRFSGNFSTKLQAHIYSRAAGGSSLPTGSLLKNKPSDRALPPTPLPQASPSPRPALPPHRNNSGLAFCSSLLTGYLAQVFLVISRTVICKVIRFCNSQAVQPLGHP